MIDKLTFHILHTFAYREAKKNKKNYETIQKIWFCFWSLLCFMSECVVQQLMALKPWCLIHGSNWYDIGESAWRADIFRKYSEKYINLLFTCWAVYGILTQPATHHQCLFRGERTPNLMHRNLLNDWDSVPFKKEWRKKTKRLTRENEMIKNRKVDRARRRGVMRWKSEAEKTDIVMKIKRSKADEDAGLWRNRRRQLL